MALEITTSGLNSIDRQLNEIGNNIANSGTVGFRAGRIDFFAMYGQGEPQGVRPGDAFHNIGNAGILVKTGASLDLGISGNGFFITKDINGQIAYTRAGNFTMDKEGFLINAQNNHIQGYGVDANGNIITGVLQDLMLKTADLAPKSTDTIDFSANLDSSDDIKSKPFDKDDKDSYNDTYTTQVYDEQGKQHDITQYFVKTADNQWEVHYAVDGNSDPNIAPNPVQLTFDNQGKLLTPTAPVSVKFPMGGGLDPITVNVNYAGTSQYGSDFSVSKNSANGYGSGTQNGQSVGKDGKVYALYSNGQKKLVGQLVFADFPDNDGLQAVSGTSWIQTNESGDPIYGTPTSGAFGGIDGGALENSNVDLSSELVNLMTAQRNYQANTKVISTDQTMMTSLMQSV